MAQIQSQEKKGELSYGIFLSFFLCILFSCQGGVRDSKNLKVDQDGLAK
jgi:hypothetical protein